MAEDPPTRAGGRPPRREAAVPLADGWYVGPPADPYRLQLVGDGIRGGEGTLWQARYRGRLSAPLARAVKQLRRPPGAGADWPTPEDLRRWEDQKALLQHLRIEHLVTVYDVFLGASPHQPGVSVNTASRELVPYVEMEWVPGPTLLHRVGGTAASRDTLAERLRHVAELAGALQTMHSQTRAAGNPVLHRDIKPANCIIDPARGLVLVDVSTLRPVADGRDPDGRHTPAYTAPEVLRDPYAPRHPASDVYALGALAVFCLTGADPGYGVDRAALHGIARRAGVRRPAPFVSHLLAALDPDPGRRPGDAARWAAELRELVNVHSRARWLVPLGAAVAAGAVIAAVALLPDRGPGPGAPQSLPTASGDAGGPARTGTVPPANSGLPPEGTASASESASSTSAPPVRPAGAIGSPGTGSAVQRCSYFTGTSTVPQGSTLVLVAINLDNDDPNEYLQPVFDWETAASRRTWRAAQFFGSTDSSAGQRYRVELRVATATEVSRALADPANRPSWSEPRATPTGSTLAAVLLHREAGEGQFPCGH